MSDIPASIASIQSSAHEARRRGKAISANPYPDETDAHRVWANAFALAYSAELEAA